MKERIYNIIQPSGVFIAKYNGRSLDQTIMSAVMSFFFLFFFCFSILTFLLSLYGLDSLTALSAAGSALANVGPGLGDIVGPPLAHSNPYPMALNGCYPWGCCLGRLELFTVLVLFMPDFWRR